MLPLVLHQRKFPSLHLGLDPGRGLEGLGQHHDQVEGPEALVTCKLYGGS